MVSFEEIQAAYYMVAATGVLVAAAYYIVNMRATLQVRREANMTQRQQLETRQAQMFMGIYTQLVNKEFMTAFGKIMDSQWKNYEEHKVLHDDTEFMNALSVVSAYFEGIGVLVREGLLDIKLVALLIAGMTRSFWDKMKTSIYEERKDAGMPRLLSETEYLYNELMKYQEKHPELKA